MRLTVMVIRRGQKFTKGDFLGLSAVLSALDMALLRVTRGKEGGAVV